MMLNRLAVTFAALGCVYCATYRAAADPAPAKSFKPNLGAIRVSGCWKGTTFIQLTGESRFAVSEPLDQKSGPTWSKQDLIPVLQKLCWRR